jgi:hypothetical protein
MAWNPNIPQPTDTLSQSQADILGNFQALDALFDDGIQNVVLLPVQTSDPATSATQIALYSKIGITGSQDLFMRKISNGAVVDMTASLQAANGWSYLPSGLLIKWGSATLTQRNDLETIAFPTGGGIPVFNSIFSITASQTFPGSPSLSQINTAVAVGNFSVTNFQVFARAIGTPSSTPSLSITYFAIGN